MLAVTDSAFNGELFGPGPLVPVNLTAPAISGTTTVGQTLSTTNGTWTQTPTSFTYQWYRNGVSIGGATSSTYVLASADLGDMITVAVTAINAIGSSSPQTSAAVGPVVPVAGAMFNDASFSALLVPVGLAQ